MGGRNSATNVSRNQIGVNGSRVGMCGRTLGGPSSLDAGVSLALGARTAHQVCDEDDGDQAGQTGANDDRHDVRGARVEHALLEGCNGELTDAIFSYLSRSIYA